MRFAVVEYASKTGKIWKHTKERPNYLCDPQKEIDPTSFGCYVSALEGEHIPILSLVKPSIVKRVMRKVSGRWPRYDISYLSKFDVIMIVHQISDGHEVTALTKRIRSAFPSIKIIGVPTQPYGILKDYWTKNPDWKSDFQDFMDSCHVFISIVESTVPAWKEMTSSPVIYLPQPYPTAYSETFAKPRTEKEKILFVAGRTDRDNISKGLLVAKALQEQFPEYIIHATSINDDDIQFDTSNLDGARYAMQPFLPWQEHLKYLSSTYLVINTDYTRTRGRVQADCAAVGTPSIGADSDGQEDLFQSLPAFPTQSVEELVTQGAKLLRDTDYYDQVTKTAHEKLADYSYAKSADRITTLVQGL